MTLTAPAIKTDYEPAPKGNHPAKLYEIIDMGTQEYEWQGDVKSARQVRLGFELLGKTKTYQDKDGNDQEGVWTVRQTFTFSLGEKANLTPIMKSLLGDDFSENADITKALGKKCLINVDHKTSSKGNTYAKITGGSPLPEGLGTPDSHESIEDKILAPMDKYFDKELWENLSKYTKDELMKAPEWQEYLDADTKAEDVPF